jgi:hypothetical protein
VAEIVGDGLVDGADDLAAVDALQLDVRVSPSEMNGAIRT